MAAYVVYTMHELKDPALFAEYRKAIAQPSRLMAGAEKPPPAHSRLSKASGRA